VVSSVLCVIGTLFGAFWFPLFSVCFSLVPRSVLIFFSVNKGATETVLYSFLLCVVSLVYYLIVFFGGCVLFERLMAGFSVIKTKGVYFLVCFIVFVLHCFLSLFLAVIFLSSGR